MKRWKELIRSNSGWLIVLASVLLLPLILDLMASLLEKTFGQTPAHLIRVVAALLAVAVVLWFLGTFLRGRPDPVVLVPRDARPPRSPGLISLVGPGRAGEKADPLAQAAAKAIEYHLADGGPLKVCWLVASSGAEGSVPVAEALSQACENHCKIVVRQVGDAFSVQDTYDVVQKIYNQEIYADEFKEHALTPDQVIADFTGGTKPMSAGMVLACGRYRPMQYMTGRKPGIASMPQLVEFLPTRRRRGG